MKLMTLMLMDVVRGDELHRIVRVERRVPTDIEKEKYNCHIDTKHEGFTYYRLYERQ